MNGCAPSCGHQRVNRLWCINNTHITVGDDRWPTSGHVVVAIARSVTITIVPPNRESNKNHQHNDNPGRINNAISQL